MKYLVLDKKNVIMHISDTIGYQENGNILVDNANLAYAAILVDRVSEVEEVPKGVTARKYCYTEEDGFTANPNYVEPEPSQLDRMEQEINNIKTSIEDYNTYKTAYNEFTDASDASPVTLRANIQVLMKSASDTAIVNVEPFIDSWVAGTQESPTHYEKDMPYKYNGQVYKCNQTHDNHGEDGYDPASAPALFSIAHTKDKNNPKPFVQPTGAHDVYMKDECCLFDGKVYVSIIDNNAYSPESYPDGWEVA